jgi:nucleoside-diphosphate kinase
MSGLKIDMLRPSPGRMQGRAAEFSKNGPIYYLICETQSHLGKYMETTFVIIKPNGVKNGLIGEIIGRYEKARLSLSGLKIKNITKAEAESFYGEHKERGFFGELVAFMTSGPSVLLALSGEKAVEKVRTINGATNPANAGPGTIRHDFAPNTGENIVHSSDSTTSAAREVAFWFEKTELVSYPAFSHIRG